MKIMLYWSQLVVAHKVEPYVLNFKTINNLANNHWLMADQLYESAKHFQKRNGLEYHSNAKLPPSTGWVLQLLHLLVFQQWVITRKNTFSLLLTAILSLRGSCFCSRQVKRYKIHILLNRLSTKKQTGLIFLHLIVCVVSTIWTILNSPSCSKESKRTTKYINEILIWPRTSKNSCIIS